MSDRDEKKARYKAYVLAARDWAPNLLDPQNTEIEVRVAEHADVREIEGGAFVEATIWIPRHMIPDA